MKRRERKSENKSTIILMVEVFRFIFILLQPSDHHIILLSFLFGPISFPKRREKLGSTVCNYHTSIQQSTIVLYYRHFWSVNVHTHIVLANKQKKEEVKLQRIGN